jgi:DNA-binding HxlR family transcriptional regulator
LGKTFQDENFLDQALEIAGKKYDLLIIDAFLKNRGKRRFNQLLEDIPKTNPRIVSMRLKEFEKTGLITKNLVFGTPVKTEYHLTEKGEKLEKAIDELKKWGKKQTR